MEKIIKDYVLYDRAKNYLIRFDYSGDIVLYGIESEAIDDKELLCDKWEVLQYDELPRDKQKEIIKQIDN